MYDIVIILTSSPDYMGNVRTEGGVPLIPQPVHSGKTHPMSASAPLAESQSTTHRMSAGAQRFLITTSSQSPATELPQKVALGQNYPNPFNPTTVISYQLPANSRVSLEIYDMLGQKVATLVEGAVEAGEHQVNFNAGNLSSGIYLYRLQVLSSLGEGGQTDRKIITKKLTLIK